MNYAAATFDNNPLFFNDERKEGIIVHPMFSVAITWPIIENLSQYLDTADFPREVLLTQVHCTEHLISFFPSIPPKNWLVRSACRESSFRVQQP